MDRRLFVLALGMFALGTDSFVVAGVLPQISHTFNVSIGAAGQMTTVYAVTYALLAPTIAALAAGVNRKTMLLSGLGVFVVANVATALSLTFAIAMLTRIIAGFGAAMFAPTATGAAVAIVAPERRGVALSVVIAGLSLSTALGTPIGAVIGGLGDWRWTMRFVAGLAFLAGIGVWAMLAEVPLPPHITLKQRLAPLANRRIGWTLASNLLVQTGTFTVYTYFAVVLDRAIRGDTLILGGLLVLWGVAGTYANLHAGRLIDRIGTQKVLVSFLIVLLITVALLPWSGAYLWSTLLAMVFWGGCAWGQLVPQQHRLVSIAPASAPVVLGLNTSCTYLGVSAAGLIGAAGIRIVGAHNLGLISAVAVALAIAASQLAREPAPTPSMVRSAG